MERNFYLGLAENCPLIYNGQPRRLGELSLEKTGVSDNNLERVILHSVPQALDPAFANTNSF
jgi:hypothetical protein